MAWRAWDLRAALADFLRAALPDDVAVFDGPRRRGATPKRYVLVGVDGATLTDEPADSEGINATQAFSSIGPGTWRDEAGSIPCTIVAWTGDTDVSVVDAVVAEIHGLCAAALAADPTVGGALEVHDSVELTSLTAAAVQTKKGVAAGGVFSIAYRALVTT